MTYLDDAEFLALNAHSSGRGSQDHAEAKTFALLAIAEALTFEPPSKRWPTTTIVLNPNPDPLSYGMPFNGVGGTVSGDDLGVVLTGNLGRSDCLKFPPGVWLVVVNLRAKYGGGGAGGMVALAVSDVARSVSDENEPVRRIMVCAGAANASVRFGATEAFNYSHESYLSLTYISNLFNAEYIAFHIYKLSDN